MWRNTLIDDFGFSVLNDEQRHDLLEIMEDRYERRSTIIAGQLPVEHWHEAIGDATIADAILPASYTTHTRFTSLPKNQCAKRNRRTLTNKTPPASDNRSGTAAPLQIVLAWSRALSQDSCGAVKSISLPLPVKNWQLRQTSPEAIAEFDRLLEEHTYPEIAAILNEKGFRSGEGKFFDPVTHKQLKCVYKLKSRYDRMRERGFITAHEIGSLLDVPLYRVHELRKAGHLIGYPVSSRREVLFLPPDQKTRKAIARLPYKPLKSLRKRVP